MGVWWWLARRDLSSVLGDLFGLWEVVLRVSKIDRCEKWICSKLAAARESLIQKLTALESVLLKNRLLKRVYISSISCL
jgi:hypothetical protein